MAVLDGLPGVEVTIVVDGADLHEYQDTDTVDDRNPVTKYIEAVDNTNFAIKIKVTKDATFEGDALVFYTKVDGTCIFNPVIQPIHVQAGAHTKIVEGVEVGHHRIRKLKFNALETVTEHGFGLPKDIEWVKNLGKIEIQVCHRNVLGQTAMIYGKPDAGNKGFISEKAIKGQGMTHSYSLDKETYQSVNSTCSMVGYVVGAKDPAAIFTFHYRSKASLKELMIIPRIPSPVPLEDRPINELSPEEMVELVAQLKAKVANTAAIKREREDDNDNSRASKRTRSSASADPAYLELNDDDETFTEVAVAPKDKIIISLDD